MKPKALLPLKILFVLLCFQTSAQTTIGVKGGLSIPDLSSGSSDNPINSGYSSRLGPDFAVFATFPVSKTFSIQPQVEYSAQGGKKNGDQAFAVPAEWQQLFPPGMAPKYMYANYNSEAKLNYLLVPVLARFNFGNSPKLSWYVNIGPFVGFLLSAKNVTSGTSTIYLDAGHTQPLPVGDQSFDNTEDVKDELHKANFGAAANIGLAYKFGTSAIFIEGGGNYGFINIQKNSENGKNNTGAAVVVVGYMIQLK